jgi:glucuronate isomerase
MELKDPFGITRLLNGESAESIWEECNEMLQQPEFSTRGLIKRNKVKVVATTDDPTDSLKHHIKMKEEGDVGFKMVPTFRPDRGMQIENENEFKAWVRNLEEAADLSISTYRDFLDALKDRHDLFHELGCRASDHGAAEPFSDPFTDQQLEDIFSKVMKGETASKKESRIFKSAFLYHCGLMDHEKEWVFQLHVGALRNNSSRKMKNLGPDTGFDSIGDFQQSRSLARFLNELDLTNELPKTILYNLNPADNEVMATMTGNFNDGSEKGKIQYGSAWWFLDQKDGMEEQMNVLSNMGLLSCFVGMLTDSRSFLSFPRHEYFRRILCNLIGNDIDNGELPGDLAWLGKIVSDVCYYNAKEYFNFHTVTV